MENAPAIDIFVSEVGPRDGLQSVKRRMATEDKLRWVEALAAAGLPEIEGRLLRSSQAAAADADTAAVVAHALELSHLHVAVLVPIFAARRRRLRPVRTRSPCQSRSVSRTR